MAEEISKPAASADQLEIDETTRPDTETNFLLVLIIGLVLTFVILALTWLIKDVNNRVLTYIHEVMWKRGPIQWCTLWFGMMVVAHVVLKSFIIKQQRSPMYKELIDPLLELGVDKNITNIRQDLQADPEFDDSILMRRVDRSMLQWLGCRDVSLVANWSATESDREFDSSASSQIIAQVLLSMIPLLGFIGTVLGLSQAVGGFSDVLGQEVEMKAIMASLKEVTGDLGTAFDTTLLALVLSVILTFPLTIMIRRENEMLTEFGTFVDDKIVSRLPPQEPATIRIENLEDSIDAAFRRYIPDPDRYDEVFSRAIDKAGSTVQEKFAALISSYEAAMSDMTQKLASHLTTAGDHIESSMRGIVDDVQKQDQIMVDNRRTIAEEESVRLQGMLTNFHTSSSEVAGLYQQKAEELQTTAAQSFDRTVNAAEELSNRLAEIQGMAGKIDELLKLEQSVQKSLDGLQTNEEFRETLSRLRGHLESTDEFCKQMSKPRVITFKEEPVD